MSVTITKIDDRTYSVNGKRVRQNMDGYWIQTEELTPNEEKQFHTHLNAEKLDLKNRMN